LPFVIFGVVILHIWAKKISDSGNPLGIEVKTKADQIPFHPYYTIKDAFGAGVFFCIFAYFLFFAPNAMGHPDNYIPANSLVTPDSIVPEWYFLPFYAILRSITFDIGIPFTDIVIIPAKLLGVIAMFASILLLFFLPWLDTSKVRSARFRPTFKYFFWFLVIDMVVLTIAGGKKPEGIWPVVSLIGTFYYFAHFLVVLPLLGKFEKTLPLPESISQDVLAKAAK
ncbi:MAG: cytochrome b, partial [Kordiimonadaceae bacterium]|nr:cytochrome b [Kordiimonadaceae bacterium]